MNRQNPAARRVSVLTTGGTIASLPTGSGVGVAVAGADLLPRDEPAPATVEVREIMLANSFNLSRRDLMVIARAVLDELSHADAVVVTHGTDTMEETAYFIDLVAPPDAVVVFTGAQRHAGEHDADGPRNLSDAIRLAAHPTSRGIGACIVMAGRVHLARNFVKVHTLAPDGFASPGRGPVGDVFAGQVRLLGRPVRPVGFDLASLGELDARVDIVPSYLDADGVQIAACRAAGARGIVLQGTGAGNPTPGVLEEVRACVAAGIVVLVTSRCPEGPATPVYGNGGGIDLAAAGAVFASTLPAPKARLLLTAALSTGLPADAAIKQLLPFLTV